MERRNEIGLVLTMIGALFGACAGLYLGFQLGMASGNSVGRVIIGAFLGLLVGPGLGAWASLALARQERAGRTAGYLTIGWALSATIMIYVLYWLDTPHNVPGVLMLLAGVALAARALAGWPARTGQQ
jgi:hypothetical protein